MNNDVIRFRFGTFGTNVTFLERIQARWTFEAKTRVGF